MSELALPPRALPPWRPWEFLAMLGVILAFHLLFMVFFVPRLMQMAASMGVMLPWGVRAYFFAARFVTQSFFPLGGMLLVAALGWLLGFHLMLRRHPRVQLLYARAVYFALALILIAVYALVLFMGLSKVDFL